jgi:hypothetical protein
MQKQKNEACCKQAKKKKERTYANVIIKKELLKDYIIEVNNTAYLKLMNVMKRKR